MNAGGDVVYSYNINYIYVDEVYDKFQKATLCLLKRGVECIELIYTK